MFISMRKNSKVLKFVLWIVVFAFLATIVVVWGIGDRASGTNYVAKVGEHTITQSEYTNRYNAALKEMQAAGQTPERNSAFEKMVVNDLVTQHLLLQEAKALKLHVTDTEVAAVITSTPAFQTNGIFNTQQYQQVLISNGYTPNKYEENIRKNLLLNKMVGLIIGSVAVSPDEMIKEFTYGYTELSASYFTVSADSYLTNTKPDDDMLQTYYDANMEKYRLAPSIKLKYIKFSPDNFEYTPNITDIDLQNRYTSDPSSFTTPESLDLSQLAILVPSWDNQTEVSHAYEIMTSVLNDLKSGTSFDAVAKKYSKDVIENKIGTITKPDDLDSNPILQQIFALQSGQVSEIIKSDYGVNIFKVDNHTMAYMQPFDEVKDVLRVSMEDEAKNKAYRDYVYSISRAIVSAGNISAYLAQNPDKFKVVETDYIFEDDPNAFFQQDKQLKDMLFSLPKTEVSPMVERPDGTYIYELDDRINSHIPALNEIKDKVVNDYLMSLAFNSALDAVNKDIPVTIDNQSDFNAVAKKFNTHTTTIPTFKRVDAQTQVAWADELINILFTSTTGTVVKYPEKSNNLIYVVHIDNMRLPLESEMTAHEDAIKNYLLSIKQKEALSSALQELRNKYKVIVNPAFQ